MSFPQPRFLLSEKNIIYTNFILLIKIKKRHGSQKVCKYGIFFNNQIRIICLHFSKFQLVSTKK